LRDEVEGLLNELVYTKPRGSLARHRGLIYHDHLASEWVPLTEFASLYVGSRSFAFTLVDGMPAGARRLRLGEVLRTVLPLRRRLVEFSRWVPRERIRDPVTLARRLLDCEPYVRKDQLVGLRDVFVSAHGRG
jgi:hypothetical protein